MNKSSQSSQNLSTNVMQKSQVMEIKNDYISLDIQPKNAFQSTTNQTLIFKLKYIKY